MLKVFAGFVLKQRFSLRLAIAFQTAKQPSRWDPFINSDFKGHKVMDIKSSSQAELFAYGLGYVPMLNMGTDVIVAVDFSGNQFKIVTLPKEKTVKRFLLSPRCVGLCGYELKRPHLCCITGACDFKKL